MLLLELIPGATRLSTDINNNNNNNNNNNETITNNL